MSRDARDVGCVMLRPKVIWPQREAHTINHLPGHFSGKIHANVFGSNSRGFLSYIVLSLALVSRACRHLC